MHVNSSSSEKPALEVRPGMALKVRGQHFGPSVARPTRRQYAIRRLVALVLALGVLAVLGGTVYGISRSGVAAGPGRSARSAALRQTPATTIPVTTTTLPPPPMEPGGGLTLFPSHRLVAFYGAPNSPTLGVLGDAPPETMWPRLSTAVSPYGAPGTVVVPSYELIAFVAQAHPGVDGAYAAELPVAQIASYLQVVHEHGGMLILDIQPGRGSLLADAQALRPWLIQPDVGLALDPEWELAPGQLPDRQIGHTTAGEINQVSAWLEELTTANRLPQKLLMVHQFRADMIVDKPSVAPQPDLAIAFNMDGFGTVANKLSVYQLLASDARWTLGYKVFYTRDRPMQTPAQVLALTPSPLIIEYE